MAKTAVEQWDETAAGNTDINSIPIDGAVTTPSQVDNIVREMMSQIAVQMGEVGFEGADIASATPALSSATGWSLDITGTTTITAFGTVPAGQLFMLRFTGALILTHNATTLILPGAANITTVAGDIAFMKSEGSGNWRCMLFVRMSGAPISAASVVTDDMSGLISVPTNKSYTIRQKASQGGTITEATTKCLSGTCTATFKINTTALGGTANAVSSAEQSQAHASANVFVAGDDIVVTVSANASCLDAAFSLKYTRALS